MITYRIRGSSGESLIVLGESLDHLDRYITNRNCAIVTDEHIAKLYGDRFPSGELILTGCGEQHKTLRTVEMLYQRFLDARLDRSSLVLAVGGGLVSDMAGFAASTYLRGLRFGVVATTLLAQVDAGVGGKTGVNFQGYKNTIGVFAQPEFVLMNFEVLRTLPPRVLGCGFAEAIKHGAIADPDLFCFMEDHVQSICALEASAVERIVNDSVRIKAAVVNNDEKEDGDRRKLNFGHTFGHAVEKTLGLPHGESVAIGMMVAAELSHNKGGLSRTEVERLRQLLEAYGLPTSIESDKTALKEAMQRDKKRYGTRIRFVLLEELGRAVVEDLDLEELETAIDNMHSAKEGRP
ncbi:3-dehydroquinate synthase [candidate division KSB3 bacterium]|uniref:3-dehydroquinate synthase n=1 Tax=candidate division KSB3 bacterium TaxID=2044937 RepID=A0A2G6E8F3_9BACT|nr:MAG: 3-dehydroquinate synthase [candidate division KSB3 bacterium]PIE30649.1 MAG: 3-dehydroquinate synthase [candidate division KSB3 bacterium]